MAKTNTVKQAMRAIMEKQSRARKPLAIILAGHNGSGKSTLWYEKGLAGLVKIPLINADRMMLSVLPQPTSKGHLPKWAQSLRDSNEGWMSVAQGGVSAFVALATARKVLFAMETVFSHWEVRPDGSVDSKIDLIKKFQAAGYFVLLIFVGLTNVNLSIGRVNTRKVQGGHDVPVDKLTKRFSKTQNAIREAIPIADAAMLVDNSRSTQRAFTLCQVRVRKVTLFDIRDVQKVVPIPISAWLDVVAPI